MPHANPDALFPAFLLIPHVPDASLSYTEAVPPIRSGPPRMTPREYTGEKPQSLVLHKQCNRVGGGWGWGVVLKGLGLKASEYICKSVRSRNKNIVWVPFQLCECTRVGQLHLPVSLCCAYSCFEKVVVTCQNRGIKAFIVKRSMVGLGGGLAMELPQPRSLPRPRLLPSRVRCSPLQNISVG